MFCLRQSLGLEESINLLSSNETPTVQESAASANHNSRDESRGRKGRRYQGRGRFINRGSSRSQGNSSSRYDSSSRIEKSGDRVEKSRITCYWYNKKGYKQQDCRRYQASRKKDIESKDEQAGNVAIAVDKYESSIYLPKQAMISMTPPAA